MPITITAYVTVGAVDTTPPVPVEPTALNTGWAATGVSLTNYPITGGPAGPVNSGTLTITTPNLVLDKYDFHCRVAIAAANVKITRSQIRGTTGLTGTSYGVLQTTSASCVNFVGEDLTIAPDVPADRWTCVLGHNATYRRCWFSRGVDNGGGYASTANPVLNVFENCFFDDMAFFSPSPGHPNDQPVSHSHSDGYQGQGGSGHTFKFCSITGMIDTTVQSADGTAVGDILRPSTNANTLGGYNPKYPKLQGNSAFQFTQPATPVGSPVADIWIEGCWLGGGFYTINIGAGTYSNITIINNRFRRDSGLGVPISVPNAATGVVIAGNVWDDDGTPVPVQRY